LYEPSAGAPSECAGGVEPLHRVEVVVELRGLEHRVDQAAVALAGFQQLLRVLDVAPEGRDRGGDVLAVPEAEDGVLGVRRRVGGAIDRLDRVVLHHLFQRRIGLPALRQPRHLLAAIREQVADRDQLDVGVMLEAEGQAELADAVADDPHADLAVAEGLPLLRPIIVGPGLVEAGDLAGLLRGPERGGPGRDRRGRRQERPSGEVTHVKRVLP